MEKERKDVYLIQTMLVSLISACIIFGYFMATPHNAIKEKKRRATNP